MEGRKKAEVVSNILLEINFLAPFETQFVIEKEFEFYKRFIDKIELVD